MYIYTIVIKQTNKAKKNKKNSKKVCRVKKKYYIYIVKQKQIITIKINTMRKLNNKFNKLDSFEKFQVSTFGVVMTFLAVVVIQWGLNGFATMAM